MWCRRNDLLKFISLFILLQYVSQVKSLSRQQLKNSGKLLKNICMPKHNVTEDQVGSIDKGKFIEDRNVMCYIACIYSVSQAIKNDKVVLEGMIKQVDMMFPPELKAPIKASIEHCRGVAPQYSDICEAAYWTAKCMYDYDPSIFIFA